MARPYRKFTQAEIDQAKQLREQGLSYVAIGRELGRAATAVEHRLAKDAGVYHSLGRVCSACPTAIPNANKTGFCRPCGVARQNSDPAFQARRQAAVRASPALATGSPVRKAVAKKATATRMANPAYVEWLREQVRTVVQPASRNAKRDYQEIGRKHRERMLGWCPLEYRDAYRLLVISKGIKAVDARQIILDQVKADRASLSPFERQMRALERGAQLIANDVGPRFGEVLKAVGE